MEQEQLLIKLSNYLKNYQLYQYYQKINSFYEKKIEWIYQHSPHSKNQMNQQNNTETYCQIINEINQHQSFLKNIFQNYNFSETEVKQVTSEYKILLFEFIRNKILDEINKKQFESNKKLINYIYVLEKVLCEYIQKNLYYDAQYIASISQKSIESVIEKIFKSQKPKIKIQDK